MGIMGRAQSLAGAASFPSTARRVAQTYSLITSSDPLSSSLPSAPYSTTFTLSSIPRFKKKPQPSVLDEFERKGNGYVDDAKSIGVGKPKVTSAPGHWPRPSEIPWQSKVANAVSLIGTVGAPVQFGAAADGKHYARTVISQDASHDASPFRIPITFEGDLAHVAVCHLKENDSIHVLGKLNADSLLFSFGDSQTHIQVVARSINFIEKPPQQKKDIVPLIQEGIMTKNHPVRSSKCSNATLRLWANLIENPKRWSDYRTHKQSRLVNPRHPDFKSKDGEPLWLNTAPASVLSRLDGLEFDGQKKNSIGEDPWRSLLENPGKWWDNREHKTYPSAPDFRHKTMNLGLWLENSPDWVKSMF